MAHAFSVQKYPGGLRLVRHWFENQPTRGAGPPALGDAAPQGHGAIHFINSVQIAVLYSAAFGEQVGMN